MTRWLTIGTILTVAALSPALAQTSSGSSGNSASSPQNTRPLGAGEKVPPHQQPRASDAPMANVQQPAPEDRELDRRLKGICRGC